MLVGGKSNKWNPLSKKNTYIQLNINHISRKKGDKTLQTKSTSTYLYKHLHVKSRNDLLMYYSFIPIIFMNWIPAQKKAGTNSITAFAYFFLNPCKIAIFFSLLLIFTGFLPKRKRELGSYTLPSTFICGGYLPSTHLPCFLKNIH